MSITESPDTFHNVLSAVLAGMIEETVGRLVADSSREELVALIDGLMEHRTHLLQLIEKAEGKARLVTHLCNGLASSVEVQLAKTEKLQTHVDSLTRENTGLILALNDAEAKIAELESAR